MDVTAAFSGAAWHMEDPGPCLPEGVDLVFPVVVGTEDGRDGFEWDYTRIEGGQPVFCESYGTGQGWGKAPQE